MSYYKPSFSQTMAMSRGGSRGYSSSRGMSYRGGGGRGGYSSRGGWNSSSTYDPRRYESSANDRYSSRRVDESNYKRSYRSEMASGYSGHRESSSHRSPERKRMRNEGSSSRRSHDGYHDSYQSSNHHRYDDNHHHNESSRSHSYRPTSYNDQSSQSYRAPPPPPQSRSDDYRNKSMRVVRNTSGSGYRGSMNRLSLRGSGGNRSLRELQLRRRALDRGGYIRKRNAALRVNSEYIRRLKIRRRASRLAMLRRKLAKRTSDVSDKEKDSDSDKDKDENDDDKKDAEKKEGESSDKEEKEGEDSAKKEKATPKKDKKKDETNDKDEKKDESASPRSRFTGKPFIKLTCTHCHRKCVTFNEYALHLSSGQHISSMRKIALKQKAQLSRMRLNQRNAQREIEKTDENLTNRTNFCPLCKLNYRQPKAMHRLSDAHRQMKKFLMPYCKVCRLTFKSPMLYENHLASLSHIKRKARTGALEDDKYSSDKEPASPAEEDLENMMTLDSVGDVDDEESEKPNTDTKESINVGVDHVKKVEVYYCDLCRIYLSRHATPEREIKEHCRGRMHLQRYVRYKEVKDLRKQAERIHRKSQEAKEKKEGVEDDIKKEVKNEEDDKLWADVDKDLGEILAEVNAEGGNKSSDEDEDSRPNGERYDRFKNSEKKLKEKKEGEGGEAKDGEEAAVGNEEGEQNENEELEEEKEENDGEGAK